MLSPGVLLLRLSAASSIALRRGVWFRVRPPARALIEAVLLHLKRGGRVRSLTLFKGVKRGIRASPLPQRRAKTTRYAIAERLRIETDCKMQLSMACFSM
ncbi:MAG: hypothetical protein QW598_01545 [Pyrobaculum sp.]